MSLQIGNTSRSSLELYFYSYFYLFHYTIMLTLDLYKFFYNHEAIASVILFFKLLPTNQKLFFPTLIDSLSNFYNVYASWVDTWSALSLLRIGQILIKNYRLGHVNKTDTNNKHSSHHPNTEF